jgi:hypothetical protein
MSARSRESPGDAWNASNSLSGRLTSGAPVGGRRRSQRCSACRDAARPSKELRVEARQAAEEARAANTERAYAADWRDFSAFCARIGCAHLPAEPETITRSFAPI